MLNLLTEPLLQVQTDAAPAGQAMTLPELLQALARDQVRSYPALPAHQEPYWHCFLTQLAYLALEAAAAAAPARPRRPRASAAAPPEIPTQAGQWDLLLHRLTAEEYPQDEPWQLAVADYTRPAFLQSPVASESKAEDYKRSAPTPDSLDLTITSKNHDVKANYLRRHRPEHWIYALVTLQTAGGFSGAGNYGIFRMNGGFSSRPFVGLTPRLRPGAAFLRDLKALQSQAAAAPAAPDGANAPLNPAGHKLLWLPPWNGGKNESFPLEQVHPWAIEVGRRLRLEYDPAAKGIKQAWRATSAAARCQPWPGGAVGDPWTPVNNADPENPKALTLPVGGFTPRRLLRYLFNPEWTPPPLAQPTAAEIAAGAELLLTARGLTRGSGKTDGWSAQEITIPAILLPSLSEAPENAAARAWGITQTAALSAALDKAAAILAHTAIAYGSGSGTGSGGDSAAGAAPRRGGGEAQRWGAPAVQDFHQAVAPALFPALARLVAAPDEAAAAAALETELLNTILPALTAAWQTNMNRRPTPALQQPTRQAQAYSLLQSRLRGPQGFPQLFPAPSAVAAAAAAAAAEEEEAAAAAEQAADADPEGDEWPVRPEQEAAETAAASPETTEPTPPHLLPPGDQAVRIAQRLAHPRTPRETVIRLAHLNPEKPESKEFWELLTALQIRPAYGQRENWAALVQNIAQLTPLQGRGQPQPPEERWWPSAHNPQRSLGQALGSVAAGKREPLLEPTRLQQLLSAQGPTLRHHAAWAIQTLKAQGAPYGINLRQLAALLLPPNPLSPQPDPGIRHQITREYARALRRSQSPAAAA